MAGKSIAKRYATALLDLGADNGVVEPLRDQLDEVASLFEQSKPFRTAMLNPSIQLAERHATVRTLAERMDWSEITRNFMLLLLDNDRFKHVAEIAETYADMVDARSGDVRAQITSARQLDEAQLDHIREALARVTGKNVVMETDVDDSLVGGVVARVGSKVYDGSVRTQLESLRESILQEV